MTTEPTNATLFGKIAAVMGSVRILERTGRNQYDRYDYVTADAIATRIGKVMAEKKLALLPAIVSVETNEYTTAKGGTNFRTVVHMEMTLACGDTGATWTLPWFGEAIDRSDKSISKATVSSVKYFLLKTFLLAGGDEEDADAESPGVEAPQRPAERTQPPAARNTTRAAAAPRAAPPEPPQADVDMGMDGGNPFDGDTEPPTDEEHAIMENWGTFGDAYEWAIANGCENKFEAKNSMDKIVKAHGGYSKATRTAIMLAFIRRQREKQPVAA